MRTTTTITQLSTDAERRAAFPILNELRTHLDEESFAEQYEQMHEEGYRLFGLYDGDELVAVTGVKTATNFYLGKHAYVYDLVTTESRRSEGFGAELLEFVHDWAVGEGCEAVELESGLWRDDAHRFYTDRLGYEKYCYSFTYDLTNDGDGE
ncbi:GNAT family N-acetyltransferase [Natronorubrum aibiense]|uniref:GNAT family N-acetyltransferase n=1 Tax=Natronorubrum aibiense TaxID=348826 RepID=A0A5P9P0X8_9EURY|nr:GNAT family N-acetyltransferase [Natronorubrum aibiense]QFU81799.1 GNAT family N-acetyltransferase [Natronorubrum aibiense]